ncbi:MAG: OadG family protein [Lachnospiraceae bacterium]|nr:OadG family protein [Lachnospiraceae bacterium]MBO4670014.1 OadG family protein [Lachnospiraceae bacterium]MBR5667090.1 OadG family protein [Lachnospiraceae bacterium]
MDLLSFCLSAKTMERAGLNTALGIGIVFLMLILISCIIALLKLANRPAKAAPAAKEPVKQAAPAADEADDTELVAVIAAAICAYEAAQGNAVSPDSLVVRSIRKVNKSKWQNA